MIINTQIKGAGGSSGKYHLLDRVKDDSNNEIGTVVGFHTDANNTEYAVVCLDAKDRTTLNPLSTNTEVVGLPGYSGVTCFGARETATFNCDAILAQAAASSITSPAVTHCRSKTFTIDGVQYAGQIPTIMELLKIFEFREEINSADPTASQYPDYIISGSISSWSSTKQTSYYLWNVVSNGSTSGAQPKSNGRVNPILEIPNA